MYISWTDHTVTLSASVVKEVTCVKCRTCYCYAMKRTEFGTGTSVYGIDTQGAVDSAANRAAQKLQTALNDSFELVPCPNCGDYQPDMVTFLRNAQLKWLLIPAWICILGALVAFPFTVRHNNTSYFGANAIALLVGIGLILFRKYVGSRHDPNTGDPESRKQLGRSKAFLKTEDPRDR
jgi:hypothetical protein